MRFLKNLGPIQKRLLLVAVLAVVVGGGVLGYKLVNRQPEVAKPNTKNTISNSNADKTGQDNNSPSAPVSDKNANNTSTGNDLVEPSGSFVSSYSISFSKSKGDNIESLCNTTPGATCTIQLKKDGVIRTLGPTTANERGNATWNWTLQELNVTPGSWQIVVTAKLDNQTKSVTNLQNLEVSP